MRKVFHHTKRIARKVKEEITYIRLRQRHVLGFLFVCNILFFLQIFTKILSLPNTYIGSANVGLKTEKQIETILTTQYNAPVEVRIRDLTYTYRYKDLGIYLDIHSAAHAIFAKNSLPFPHNVLAFIKAFRTTTTVPVPLLFSQDYNDFTENTIYDMSQGPDLISVDQENKQLNLFPQEERYRIDSTAFTQPLLQQFGSVQRIVDAPLVSLDVPMRHEVASTNTKLKEVFDQPLTLIFGSEKGNSFIPLSKQELVNASIMNVNPDTAQVSVTVDTSGITQKIHEALVANHIRADENTLMRIIGEKIQATLTERLQGQSADSIKFAFDAGPNTDGKEADRYIEVDISQQKLFTWDRGQLVKTYRVSTGKDYPTPTGKFTILNKAPVGYSGIYHVWMPYWMAFSYSNKLHAYFGIHELPYFYSGKDKITRPREFIGAPNTGGCVALDVGEAKEVYAFAEVGTPVVVFN